MHEPIIAPSLVREEGYLAATICVKGIEALASELESKGFAFSQALKTEAWGSHTFIVADPDGNLLLFAE